MPQKPGYVEKIWVIQMTKVRIGLDNIHWFICLRFWFYQIHSWIQKTILATRMTHNKITRSLGWLLSTFLEITGWKTFVTHALKRVIYRHIRTKFFLTRFFLIVGLISFSARSDNKHKRDATDTAFLITGKELTHFFSGIFIFIFSDHNFCTF